MNFKFEKLVKLLAWLELGSSLMSVTTCIYALVVVTSSMSTASSLRKDVNKVDAGLSSVKYIGIIAIKILYFSILFFLAEACLAVFLIRTLHKKHVAHLRIWLLIAAAYCALYIADFISTLHAMSVFEDASLTIGIFVKVPLLILGYKYYTQLNEHGATLVNESI